MANVKGYMGKVLFVDLTKKTYSEFPWTDEDRKRTIGGKIMAADILLQHIKPGMKAFDEDNWLVITTGPLTRCKTPSSTRFNISTVSPLTGILTSSNCGGPFGRRLKKAGWDAMIVTGKASELTWIEIVDSEVTFHEVPEMKGMLTGEVQKQFKGGVSPLAIGPAGENKVLYAGVFSGERTAGRGGVGAVFGDKNLKVITAKGSQDPVIHDQEKLDKIAEQWKMQLLRHPIKGKASLAIMFQNVMEAASAAGCCVFTSYAILPWFIVAKPTSILTRVVQQAFKFLTPILYIGMQYPQILALNIPLIQYPRAINAAAGTKYTMGTFIKAGSYGYNVERVCNIILGLPVGKDTDTLPKRLTDEEQVPGVKKTKVPLDKMKKSYYIIRGWKDGAPTMRMIKKLGIKLPECAKEVYPYGKG